MEEADAICDRLMIMADGEVKCIGVSADLKNRFGEGYKLSVQVAKGYDQEPVDQFIKQIAPSAVLLNSLSGTRNYQVPKKSVTLDQVFQAMETNKLSLHITDWAITNTTLEEVFLSISHRYIDDDLDKLILS
jgi:ABC-type multidrug transport system ATPase subunit